MTLGDDEKRVWEPEAAAKPSEVVKSIKESLDADEIASRIFPDYSESMVTPDYPMGYNPPINIAANVGNVARIRLFHTIDPLVQKGHIDSTRLMQGGNIVYEFQQPGEHDVQPGRYSEHRLIGAYDSVQFGVHQGLHSVIAYKKQR